jgi:hypothetical protein
VKDWKAVDYVTVREKREFHVVVDGRGRARRVMTRDDTVAVSKDGNEWCQSRKVIPNCGRRHD